MPLLASGNPCPRCNSPISLYKNPILSSQYNVLCTNKQCKHYSRALYTGTDKQKAWDTYNALGTPHQNKNNNKNNPPSWSKNTIKTQALIKGYESCPDCQNKSLGMYYNGITWRIRCHKCQNKFKGTSDGKEAIKAWDFWTKEYKSIPKEETSTKRYTTKETLEINRKEKRTECIRCREKTFRKDVLMFVVEHYCSCCDDNPPPRKEKAEEDEIPF